MGFLNDEAVETLQGPASAGFRQYLSFVQLFKLLLIIFSFFSLSHKFKLIQFLILLPIYRKF